MVYVRCKVAYLSVSGDDLIIRGRLLDLIKNRSVFSITIRIRVCITYWKVSQVAHCIYIYITSDKTLYKDKHTYTLSTLSGSLTSSTPELSSFSLSLELSSTALLKFR